MKVITINGKQYTDKQLESGLREQLRGKSHRPLTQIMDEIPPEGIDPGYREIILSIQDDPLTHQIAKRKLERGLGGFGGADPLLHVAEFLIDLYLFFHSLGRK